MSHALSNLRPFFFFFATLKYDIRIKERRGIEREKKKDRHVLGDRQR